MSRALLFGLLVTLPLAARADAVDVRVQPKALVGKGDPELQIEILEPIAGFRLKLTRSDGHAVDVSGGGKPGVTRVIKLPQPEGTFRYQGELVVTFPSGETGTLPLEFETQLAGPLRLTLRPEDVDLERRKITFRLSRPAKKAHLRVQMDTGELAVDRELPLKDAPADAPLTLEWPAAAGNVLRISVRAWDTADFYTGVEVSPWRIDVPHEEIVFDSGKDAIRRDQRPKLQQSAKDLLEIVRRYGRLGELKLFVAGHTDTVGPAEQNRALSLRRARSIARFFKDAGVRIPIFYDGVGEAALLVGTPEDTPEEKNRRAEYIVAIEDPVLKSSPVQPRWQRL